MGISSSSPTSFFAGDTVKWTVKQASYLPADGWAAVVDISNGGNHYQINSADNGDGRHLINISKAVSATMPAGDYTLRMAMVKGVGASAEQYTVATATLTIRPDLSGAVDARSQVKKDLDALNLWITSADVKVAEYAIAGRSMKYHDPLTLETLRSKRKKEYRAEQNAERIMAGGKPRRRLLTRMVG